MWKDIGVFLIILLLALPIIGLYFSIRKSQSEQSPEFHQFSMDELDEKVRKRFLMMMKVNKYFMNDEKELSSFMFSYEMTPYIFIGKKQTDDKAIHVHSGESKFFKGITLYYSLTNETQNEPLIIGDKTFTYTIVRADNCMINGEHTEVELQEVI